MKNKIKILNFNCDRDGIKIKQISDSNDVLFDIEIDAENLFNYYCPNNITFGVSISNILPTLKFCKKKDVCLFELHDYNLSITMDKIKNSIPTSAIQTYEFDDLEYDETIQINSSDWVRMCKLFHHSKLITVKAGHFQSTHHLIDKNIDFTSENKSDRNKHTEMNFEGCNICFMQKLASLCDSNNKKISYSFCRDNLYLENQRICFSTNILDIGKVSIHVKSEELKNSSTDDQSSTLNLVRGFS